MKYNQIITMLAIAATVVSCNKEDDSVFDVRNVKPVITVDATSFPSLNEGDNVVLTLTTDIPYKTDMDLKISIVGGNGNFRDFEVSSAVPARVVESGITDGQGDIAYLIKFPAYAKTATVDLTAVLDDLAEPTENYILELAPALNSIADVAESSKLINMTVKNVKSPDLKLILDWSGNSADRHGTLSNASYLNNATPTPATRSFTGLDFDFYVYDMDDNLVAAAETGDCPEVIVLPASTPDGTYYTEVFYYALGANNATTPKSVNVPMKVISTKPGVFYDVLDKTGTYTTTSPPNSATSAKFLRKIVKSGATWTIQDYDTSAPVASGKNANGPKISKAFGRRK